MHKVWHKVHILELALPLASSRMCMQTKALWKLVFTCHFQAEDSVSVFSQFSLFYSHWRDDPDGLSVVKAARFSIYLSIYLVVTGRQCRKCYALGCLGRPPFCPDGLLCSQGRRRAESCGASKPAAWSCRSVHSNSGSATALSKNG